MEPAPTHGDTWNKLRLESWIVSSSWLGLAVLWGWSISQGSHLGIGVARRQHYVNPALGDLGLLEIVARAI